MPEAPPPFICYALPRSRTFWLSRFLSAGGWTCGHDDLRYLRGLKDIEAALKLPFVGSVETAAAPFWRLVQSIRPDIRTVVIRRPVDEVVDSLVRTGVQFDVPRLQREMQRLDAKLDQIEARVPGALSVTFAELNDEAVCARVFEHCLPFRHDPVWYGHLAPVNLQINLHAQMRYFTANHEQIAALARQAGQHMRAKLMARPVTSNEFVFAQEPLSVLLEDGSGLIDEHLVAVGEAPHTVGLKNLPLLQALEDVGVLHITTARQNGRMFGYLLAVTTPSFASETMTEALHTSFFTSPSAPGLGLKLQRASVDFLRERGVDVVVFRAGTRGSGPRMGALYSRLGAEEFGKMYSLDLKVMH